MQGSSEHLSRLGEMGEKSPPEYWRNKRAWSLTIELDTLEWFHRQCDINVAY
jgi:hypothetical protein